MRKFVKEQLLDIFGTLYEAHDSIKGLIEKNDTDNAIALLGDCQNTAVQIGDMIDSFEGEGSPVIHFLEEYCEAVYQVSVALSENITGIKARKQLDRSLTAAENSVKNDIKVRLEVVFMPYKASMWDSLESVWKVADEDPDCDAYVVPIPYYDRNPDRSFGAFHYEGNLYPDYVPVVHYDNYDLTVRRPDVIYIHNPYDYENYATSVDPRFYSDKLKQNTGLLIYIPYFATTGGMSEFQATCPAYYNADYIVVQAEGFSKFYDEKLPAEKFLNFGSPKFDKVIKICNNAFELPLAWKEKIRGRKTYFYNTSIGGMLENTDAFMKKMRYVFSCFENRDDACVIWRPHPMLESTLSSSRPEYIEEFDEIKHYFISNNIGIYDDTPDIAAAISAADAYIGDAGTSVTSLFGVAGKPMFILNNNIDIKPVEEDRRSLISFRFTRYCNIRWQITNKDMLYYSENADFKYKYVCNLSSQYACNNQYSTVLTVDNKHFACPANAYNILQVNETGIVKKFELPTLDCDRTPFAYAVKTGRYIYLIPNYYPAIVRFDTKNEQIKLIYDNVRLLPGRRNNVRIIGGSCIHNGLIFIGSTVDGHALVIEPETCRQQIIAIPTERKGGCMGMLSAANKIWISPFEGEYVLSWDPSNGTVREYSDFPKDYKGIPPFPNFTDEDRLFNLYVLNDTVYLLPLWSNMFLKLDSKTGDIAEWNLPFDPGQPYKNCYYKDGSGFAAFFDKNIFDTKQNYLYLCHDKKMYSADIENGKYEPVEFEYSDMDKWVTGFDRIGEYLRYACIEDVFNSLDDFLNGNITGKPFDKNAEISAYSEIAANIDGSCGKKVHTFIKEKLLK